MESDDKRRARINMIAHLLSTLPYTDVTKPPVALPPRPASKGYQRPPRDLQKYVPDRAAALAEVEPPAHKGKHKHKHKHD